MKQELSYLDMVALLREKFPEFEREYQEHMEVYKELIVHTLMADFAFWLGNFYDEGGPSKNRVQEILAEIEHIYIQGNDHVQNILDVSFLENLPNSGEPNVGLRDLLGPKLSKAYWRVNW